MISITIMEDKLKKKTNACTCTYRMKFKTVWLWPLIDTLHSSIDWDNLRERL